MKTIDEILEWLGDIKINCLKRDNDTYNDVLELYNDLVAILENAKEQEHE